MKKHVRDNEKIVKHTQDEIDNLEDKTDYQRLDAMSDEDIDYSDIPELDASVWAKAEIKDPGTKKAISLRVDNDVLDWYKQQGGRYQRLMNKVLRQYMKMH